MFFLKKYLPQLFIAILLKEDKQILKAKIYRNKNLINTQEKTFDDEKKLLEYIKTLSKKYFIYYVGLFLNNQEQGLIPSLNSNLDKFNVGKMSIKCLPMNNAQIYIATEHIEYFNELFEEYSGIDFLYSPFALLYYHITKRNLNLEKTTLYIHNYDNFLTLMICKGKDILFGEYKVFEKSFIQTNFQNQSNSLNEELFSKDDQEINIQEKYDSLENENKEDIPQNDHLDFKELNNFGHDMEICNYIFSSIQKFYNDDKYSNSFIDELIFFSDEEFSLTAFEVIENEIFLEPKFEKINTLDWMITLMQEEINSYEI
ncbi:clan AA aspartic protease [Campylobacter sp. TTU-622]|uniref:clan AA aspartic protease n=1 Tax=unclassified Campylobacter TaxID=2593542 RepID=UPI001908E871|nr:MULTISPECIES: clan AA aspartic protease [unclassified Campylobacter]MBK1971428.1 clan AA aspartic protease [Campylobacter sp. TTU_617]MBK1973580.1 clan AA aspartic protease [Campylobacter sp. TTU-622]